MTLLSLYHPYGIPETLTLVPKTNIDRDAAHRTLEDN